MKKLFVFDLDNTLRSTNLKAILPNARKLIYHIANHPDYILALATGRGVAKLDVLGDLDGCFKYKILVNGALTLEDNKVIDDAHIPKEIVAQIISKAQKRGIALGMVGMYEEVVTKIDENIKDAFQNFVDKKPLEKPGFYEDNNVYQLWVYHKDEKLIGQEIQKNYDLDIFHWHAGGIDIVSKGVSKANALKKLMKKYPDYEVIAFGDGHNDIDMMGLAHIGIIMENSRWIKEAHGKYQLIGPHVDSDALYAFLKKHNII